MICCLCKRPTHPAAFIGPMAVGPKCARKAGLLGPKKPKGVRMNATKATKPCRDTMDLFDEALS